MNRTILKHLAAVAVGAFLASASAAKIDPDHFGASLVDMLKLGAVGAVIAVGGLNTRAPKDD